MNHADPSEPEGVDPASPEDEQDDTSAYPRDDYVSRGTDDNPLPAPGEAHEPAQGFQFDTSKDGAEQDRTSSQDEEK